MKKSLKFVAALMVIVSATFVNPVTASNVNNTNTEVSTAKLLAKGFENDFVAFMENKATKFTKTNEWANFVEVIRLYNQNPVALTGLSAAKRAEFNKSAALVSEKLGKFKSADAKSWKNSVGFTTATFNFLWNQSNKSEILGVDEVIDVTTTITSM